MKEDAEAVHLDQAEEGGAAGISGEDSGGGAQARAEDGEEGEDLAAAGERLQEHQQDAEAAPDGFGEDADQVVGAGDHGRGPAFAGELVERSCCDEGTSKSRSLAALGMTILFFGDGKATPSAAKAGSLPFLTARLKSCPDARTSPLGESTECPGGEASWGKLRCMWSRTFWEGAAKRRVK